jgi:hypothetical protein
MKSFLLAAALTLVPVAAFAQAPVPAQLSPADQQLLADWQALNTALQHVQQDIIAKMQAEAAAQKQIADLQAQIAKLKAVQTPPTPAKK